MERPKKRCPDRDRKNFSWITENEIRCFNEGLEEGLKYHNHILEKLADEVKFVMIKHSQDFENSKSDFKHIQMLDNVFNEITKGLSEYAIKISDILSKRIKEEINTKG